MKFSGVTLSEYLGNLKGDCLKSIIIAVCYQSHDHPILLVVVHSFLLLLFHWHLCNVRIYLTLFSSSFLTQLAQRQLKSSFYSRTPFSFLWNGLLFLFLRKKCLHTNVENVHQIFQTDSRQESIISLNFIFKYFYLLRY